MILEVERLRDRGQRRTLVDRVEQLLPGEPSTTSTATSARRTDRGRRRARGGLRLPGSWAEIGRPPGNRARREDGCSLPTRGYPVSIPHDIENRGVATGIDWELNPHVRGLFPPPPQVTELARVNLSRWRHGFKSRWDYKQRPRSEAVSHLNRHSTRSFVPHSSRGRPLHVTIEPADGREQGDAFA